METERFYYREYPVVVIVGKRVRIISEGLAASLVHRHRKTKETNKQTEKQGLENISVILIAVLNKKFCFCTFFIEVLFIFWLWFIIAEGVTQFFSFRGVSEWRVNEMSENGLSMACDLRLFLHINIVYSRRKERQLSWLALKKYLEGIFVDCEIMVIHWGEIINKLSTFLGLFARKKA